MKNFVKKRTFTLYFDPPRDCWSSPVCAHPGIIDIVKRAKTLTDQEILFVLGGFHLLHDSSGKIRNIAAKMSDLGVKCTAPRPIVPDQTRERFFRKLRPSSYVDCGVGPYYRRPGADIALNPAEIKCPW